MKDTLYRRYADVPGLLSSFSSFIELRDFLYELIKKTQDEEAFEFYLHKTLFSPLSFNQWKSEIQTLLQSENEDEVLEYADRFIKEREAKR